MKLKFCLIFVVFTAWDILWPNNVAFASEVFISDVRIKHLQQDLAEGKQPTTKAWGFLQQACDRGLKHVSNPPEYVSVPSHYDNPNGENLAKKSFQDDGSAAYEEALCYRMTGKQEYGQASIGILQAWQDGLKGGDYKDEQNRLTVSHFFPAFIFAAGLMRDSALWSKEAQDQFKIFLREKILPFNTLSWKAKDLNNHYNWGTLLIASIGAYLDDDSLLNLAQQKWKELLEAQVSSDGTLPFEICRSDTKNWCGGPRKGRNGIWYSNFTLFPDTLIAEIFKNRGVDLYSYVSPGGHSLQQPFEKLALWTRYPDQSPYYASNDGKLYGLEAFAYFTILNHAYPDENAHWVLTHQKPRHDEPAVYMWFTHGRN